MKIKKDRKENKERRATNSESKEANKNKTGKRKKEGKEQRNKDNEKDLKPPLNTIVRNETEEPHVFNVSCCSYNVHVFLILNDERTTSLCRARTQ
jgi:hypothetical protein